VEESFAFNGKYLNGATEMKPRWKRCAESTDALFGEALGKEYVARHFPPEAKARMQETGPEHAGRDARRHSHAAVDEPRRPRSAHS